MNSMEEELTVLDCLQRVQPTLRAPCRNGVCHLCRHRCTQAGFALYRGSLNPALQALGYFLPCRTPMQAGLEVLPPDLLDEERLSLIDPCPDSERAALWQSLGEGEALAEIVAALRAMYPFVPEEGLEALYRHTFASRTAVPDAAVEAGRVFLQTLEASAFQNWLHALVAILRPRLDHARIRTWLSFELRIRRGSLPSLSDGR